MTTFDAKDKVFLISGGTSGVGKAIATGIAKLGGKAIVIARSAARGEQAAREIAGASGGDVSYLVADISSQVAIRNACAEFKQTYNRLDCLVNSAGAAVFYKERTVDGIDMSLAVNYLSHFLLTTELLDILKASKPARVITVAGRGNFVSRAKISFDDIQGDKKYSGLAAVSTGLRARVIFTLELGKRLAGSGVTANAFHPGWVRSNLIRDAPLFLRLLVRVMGAKGPTECPIGVYLAAAEEVDGITAAFFDDKMNRVAAVENYDPAEAARLWTISEELTQR